MYANFLLGELRVSDDAREALGRTPLDLIARHAMNEHGRITAAEAQSNARSMQDLGEIISRYCVDPTNAKRGCVLVTTSPNWLDTSVELER